MSHIKIELLKYNKWNTSIGMGCYRNNIVGAYSNKLNINNKFLNFIRENINNF